MKGKDREPRPISSEEVHDITVGLLEFAKTHWKPGISLSKKAFERAIKPFQDTNRQLLAIMKKASPKKRNKESIAFYKRIIDACDKPGIADAVWQYVCQLGGLPEGTEEIRFEDLDIAAFVSRKKH